jgi:putative phosphoesterase
LLVALKRSLTYVAPQGILMRILIVSDIHANPWAMNAVERDAGKVDHVICAGDTVNYGPDPRGALTWLRDHGAVSVRGNHDHAVAFGADPRAAPAKQPLALAVRDWTRDRLEAADLTGLARLPTSLTWQTPGGRFAVVHGTPLDSLYDYRMKPEASDRLVEELLGEVQADVMIAGHTHLPLLRRFGDMEIVNPGSVGQPLDGDPRAAYAIWEDGRLSLRRAAYDQAPVLEALRELPLAASMSNELAAMLRGARMS